MIKFFYLAYFILFSSSVFGENYELSVTRKASNIYKVDGKDIIVQTRYCYEYVYNENSFLKMYGSSGEIIFIDSGGKCDVKAVYGIVDQKAGKYLVTISHENDDWYEIYGQGLYIKTSGCLSLALAQEAILTLQAAGFGTLKEGYNQCMVEGIYSKMSL